MKVEFLNTLSELAHANAEYFRANGIAATLTARSEGRVKNSQALDLSHAKWHGSLVTWDSGEAEISLIRHKSGNRTTRQKSYDTPEAMRENLRDWLLQHMKI